jgi:putative aldouronate transport system permease protein
MKRKLEISELIFKIISYTLLTVFALACLYPFVYAVSASVSGRHAVEYGEVVLFPKEAQFAAFSRMFSDNMFWNAYSNTLFLTLYGTIWALGVSILGAYALSKKRLLFRKTFNFFLVFTMWFSAGIVPQYLNYLQTQKVFQAVGIMDDKWLVVIAMGMAAMNIILLRNAFENVPSEIEEAAIVDGDGIPGAEQGLHPHEQIHHRHRCPVLRHFPLERLLLGAPDDFQSKRASPAGVHPLTA